MRAAVALDLATLASYTADVFGGMSAFAAIQAALFHRSRTGEGRYIDVALLDGMLNILVTECQEWQSPTAAKSRVYPPLRTRDGFIVIAPTSQKNFEALTRVVGREEWLVDSRLATSIAREKNWAEMMALIEAWTAQHSGVECEARLMAMGVPCTCYRSVGGALSDARPEHGTAARGTETGRAHRKRARRADRAAHQMTTPRANNPSICAGAKPIS